MPQVLRLNVGNLEVGVAPEIGGSLSHFRRAGGPDYMRPATEAGLLARDPIAMACFPLVPFSGRIAAGRLDFQGRVHRLPLNAPRDPNALHGDGWQCPWTVEAADGSEIRLRLDNPARGWPWPYQAGQVIQLSADALTITLSLTNLGADPMPAGLGLHPWFDLTPHAAMTMRASTVFQVDDGYLYAGVSPVPEQWDFAAGRALADTDLVNGFAGWDGVAELTWPERAASLTIRADPPLTHLVVYTPPRQDFFCIEPVSHSVDAFNLHTTDTAPNNGTIILAPGETMTAATVFTPG